MSGSRTNKFKNIVPVILLLIIAGGLFYYLERQKKLNFAKSIISKQVAPNPKSAPQQKSAKENLNKADAQEDEDDENFEASTCSPTDETPIINVSHERFLNLIRENEIWVPAVGAQACFHVGKSITLIERIAEDGFVYAAYQRGKVNVIAIEERKMAEIENEKKYLLTSKEIGHIRKMLRRRSRLTGEKPVETKFKFLKLKSETWFEARRNYGAPLNHPQARTLDLQEFNAALGRGEIPFDVRPIEMFNFKTITGAANAPANPFDANQFVVKSPSELRKLKFDVNTDLFQNEKNKPIIIFSSCGGDFLSYNAITILKKNGFKKIRWFRGGLENWVTNGGGCGTPLKVAKINIVDGTAVKGLLAGASKLLYVYNGTNLAGYTVKGSVSLIYQQRVRGDGMAFYRPLVWNETEFKNSEDEVDIEQLKLNPSDQIIVYGRNEFDWKPLKVALMLQAKGFRSVSWYRFGIEDWINHALFRPQDFPTNPEYVRK